MKSQTLRGSAEADDLKLVDVQDHGRGREIIDSRGNPTVEADVLLDVGRAWAAPRCPRAHPPARARRWSCATATRSATWARACCKAVGTCNTELSEALLGLDAARPARRSTQRMIELDGTDNKARLGANALLGRVAGHRAGRGAATREQPLFRHLATLGGDQAQAGDAGADDEHHQWRRACRQQPRRPGVHDPAGGRAELSEALRYGAEIFHTLKKMLHDRGLATAVGDEGGFAPNLPSNEAALEIILEAIETAGYRLGRTSTWVWTWPAASSSRTAATTWKSREAAASRLGRSSSTTSRDLVARYPIITIEDGMSEADWDGWTLLTQRARRPKLQLVGDDLFVTNTKILARGIEQRHRQRHPDQAQPDRHADRDAGGHRHGRQGATTPRWSRIARARPRTAPSPTSPWPPPPRRSRPARCRARTASPSTTSCCASRRSWASVRYAGREAFPVKL